MNEIPISKSKYKFSNRNLNTIYKAPVGIKPRFAHATRPIERHTRHMLVLGRTSVAPPAPVNTLSLKSENRVHNNVHGSLVPAGSNWAENTEEMLEKEVSEDVSHADHVATVTAVSDKVWTRQSVAEHLHPSSSTVSIANSGRWGDDAVENDIGQKNLRCQIQQENEFPALKKSVEKIQTVYEHDHFSAVNNIQSMTLQQEFGQRHGRATGRWAYFNKEEIHHLMQSTGSHWSDDQYGRDKDDWWSCDRLRYKVENDRRERRLHGAERDTLSPDSIGYYDHFSRSDVRSNILRSGDHDCALEHIPHLWI